MFRLLLPLKIGCHSGGEGLVQKRLIVIFGNAVVSIQFSHLLLTNRDRVDLGAVDAHLSADAFLLFAQTLGLTIQQLQPHGDRAVAL